VLVPSPIYFNVRICSGTVGARVIRLEPCVDQSFARGAVAGGSDIKECAHSLGSKDNAAAILIGFHQVLDAGGGEKLFEKQGFFQLLGDIKQGQLLVAEIVWIATHASESLTADPRLEGRNSFRVGPVQRFDERRCYGLEVLHVARILKCGADLLNDRLDTHPR
jgi:hypothetical protein